MTFAGCRREKAWLLDAVNERGAENERLRGQLKLLREELARFDGIADDVRHAAPYVERTDGWLLRWRAVYPTGGGMDLETTHFTKIGARVALVMVRA